MSEGGSHEKGSEPGWNRPGDASDGRGPLSLMRVYCSVSRVNPVPVIDGRCVYCGRRVKVAT
jgi:hypothetical protein